MVSAPLLGLLQAGYVSFPMAFWMIGITKKWIQNTNVVVRHPIAGFLLHPSGSKK